MSHDKIKNTYKTFSKPLIGELLGVLKLDKVYHKAHGDFIYYFKDEKEIKVLDFTGGYGSLLLGHNNIELRKYIKCLYDQETPLHAQLSVRTGSALLSQKINDIISSKSGKNYISTFLNSGSEAIEAALKHSLLTFNNKLYEFLKEQETAFLNIENYFKLNKDVKISFNKKNYKNFKEFKQDFETLNQHTLRTFKQTILASKGSYHGKTLGALSVTNNTKFQKPFFNDCPIKAVFFEWNTNDIKKHISDNDFVFNIPKINTKGNLLIKTKKLNAITAVLIEPILGESGIHVVPESLLAFLRTETKQKDIPLIFDEIQCGFYRTGEFLHSFKSKIYADYYVMGKSLGGGFTKISALIIEADKYIPEFEMIHSSTYSDDDISSLVALKSIIIAEERKRNIVESGNYILQELNLIKDKYVDVIAEIRGDGLMIGISFKSFKLNQCYGLQSLARSDYFGYIIAAYLLNKENIRVSVTLSNPNIVRIHPSSYISKSSINTFVKAIDNLSYILYCNDFYSLISPILEEENQNLRPVEYFEVKNINLDSSYNSKCNVGFLVHYIDLESIKQSIPSLEKFPNKVISDFASKAMRFGAPVLLGRNEIRNLYGDKITITFIGVPFISKNVREDLNESRQNLEFYQSVCSKAINFLYDMGITTIGLGQFTSIIMQNGRAVSNSNVNVTTGNSFTVYSALKQVLLEINTRGDLTNKVAVIGAGGNIATVISLLLIEHCDEILLVGSSKNSEYKMILHGEVLLKHILSILLNKTPNQTKLYKTFENSKLLETAKKDKDFLNSGKLWQHYKMEFTTNSPIKITWDLDALKTYDITVVATSQGEPFLKPEHFKKSSLVCDISVPSNCTEELLNDNSINTEKGGIVYLPNNENLYPKGLPIKNGQAFACMCETLILGFEQSKIPYSFGSLTISKVKEIGELGEKHGFKHLQSHHKSIINL